MGGIILATSKNFTRVRDLKLNSTRASTAGCHFPVADWSLLAPGPPLQDADFLPVG